MQLIELIDITNNLFYNDSPSYKVIASKQNELLTILKPTMDIKKINYKTIEKIIQVYKAKNNSPATINSKLAYISKILNYAYKVNLIPSKPYTPTLREPEPKEKYLTKAEKVQMLLWCKNNKQKELAKIILIGLYTGLRINNILSLKDSMYREGNLYIYDKKTKKNYIIPVKNKIKYIITNLKGFNVSYNQCYYIFSLMKKDLQLDDNITIHTLRHTFGSDLVQQNITLPVIQALMNHRKITTTMKYTHLNTAQLSNAINVL